MKLREMVYKFELGKIRRDAERMQKGDNFDPSKALKLIDRYHHLTNTIYDDPTLTEDDKTAWGTAFSQCYDSSFNRLSLRCLDTFTA